MTQSMKMVLLRKATALTEMPTLRAMMSRIQNQRFGLK